MESLIDLLALAKECAYQAGSILKDGTGLRKINQMMSHDVKLQADVESEHYIRDALSNTNMPIIGEEQGGDSNLIHGDELYWVVDPLDGTYNYLRNCPECCVSIGLMKGLEPQLGVIYNFNTDDIYTGVLGQQLHVNDEEVKPQWAASQKEAVYCTGFPAGRDYSEEALLKTISQYKKYKKIRMIGSAALAIAYVSAGQYDVYREESIRLWDVAAGLALINAAGGYQKIVILDKPNAPLSLNVTAAGSEALQV